jgi:adenylate kinase family enzyme
MSNDVSPRGKFWDILTSFSKDIPRISTDFITPEGIDYKKLFSQVTHINPKKLLPLATTGTELLLTLWENKPKDSFGVQAVSSARNAIALYSVLDDIYMNIIPSTSVENRGDIMFWKDIANRFKLEIPLCDNYSTTASGILPLSDILIYLVSRMKDRDTVTYRPSGDDFVSKVTIERIGFIGEDPIMNSDGTIITKESVVTLLRAKCYDHADEMVEDVFYAISMETGQDSSLPAGERIAMESSQASTGSSFATKTIIEHAAYAKGYADSEYRTIEHVIMAIYRRLDYRRYHFYVDQNKIMVANNDSFFTDDASGCWVQSAEMVRLRSECRRVARMNMKRSYALVGPPGTGKTGMCEHLMTELCNDGYTLVRCSLDRRMMGIMLSKVLLTTKMTSRCAILFDDLDQLDIKRKSSDNVGEFLAFFAALNKSEVPIILFSTVNNPKNVNSTLMGRPERIDEVVYIKTPDIEMTKELLRRYGQKNGYSIADDVLTVVSAELVELNASVADIKNLTVMMKVKHDAKDSYGYDEFKVGIDTLKETREVSRKNFCVDGDEE